MAKGNNVPGKGINEMSYQSPIEIIQEQVQAGIENEVLKTVMHVGVVVDKEELIKALTYDRNQYTKGYNDRDSEIVRCKDCHYGIRNSKDDIFCIKAVYNDKYKRPNWFCADGEREET